MGNLGANSSEFNTNLSNTRSLGANSSASNNNIPNIGTGASGTNANNRVSASSLDTSNPPNTDRTNNANISPQFLNKYLGGGGHDTKKDNATTSVFISSN